MDGNDDRSRFEEVQLEGMTPQSQRDNWYEPTDQSARELYDDNNDHRENAYISPISPNEQHDHDRTNEQRPYKTETYRPSVDNVKLPVAGRDTEGGEALAADAKLIGMLTMISGIVLLVLAVTSFVISLVSNIGSAASAFGFGIALSVVLLLCDCFLHMGVISAGIVGAVSGWRANSSETLSLRHRLAVVYLVLLVTSLVVYNVIVLVRWVPQFYNFVAAYSSTGTFIVSILVALSTCCLAYTFVGLFIVVAALYVSATRKQLNDEQFIDSQSAIP